MIEVAAAVIVNEQGRLLIARRKPGKAQGGLWEFPGGKLEPGESAEDCLRRELLEEMNIQIQPTERLGVHEHDYGTIVIRLMLIKRSILVGISFYPTTINTIGSSLMSLQLMNLPPRIFHL